MAPVSRHQCLIYQGAPSLHLTTVARAARGKLLNNYRCLYLNSKPMVMGMRLSLEAENVDVTRELERGSLTFEFQQQHLTFGRFEPERMIASLEQALRQALADGYAGLWATGDMSWEIGSDRNISRLLEYEWQLEQFLESHPQMGGICQYRADTLSSQAMQLGLVSHQSVFINETLSRVNPWYLRPNGRIQEAALAAENISLNAAMSQLRLQGSLAG